MHDARRDPMGFNFEEVANARCKTGPYGFGREPAIYSTQGSPGFTVIIQLARHSLLDDAR